MPGVQRCAGAYTDYLEDKARARASHERIHASQQEDKRSLRAHRRESETIGHYGTARHHGARTEIRASRKFYADRASSASTRRRRNDDRRLEALASVEVRRPRSYRLRIDPPPVAARDGLALTARAATVPGRLAPVTLDLRAGEHLLVTGPNGCGKTTLLRWAASPSCPSGCRARATPAWTERRGSRASAPSAPASCTPPTGPGAWASCRRATSAASSSPRRSPPSPRSSSSTSPPTTSTSTPRRRWRRRWRPGTARCSWPATIAGSSPTGAGPGCA